MLLFYTMPFTFACRGTPSMLTETGTCSGIPAVGLSCELEVPYRSADRTNPRGYKFSRRQDMDRVTYRDHSDGGSQVHLS